MMVTIVFLVEVFTAVLAFEHTTFLVDLLDMLLEVGILLESLHTTRVVTFEGSVLRVRSHMICELRRTSQNLVAAFELALIESFRLLVTWKFPELKEHKFL